MVRENYGLDYFLEPQFIRAKRAAIQGIWAMNDPIEYQELSADWRHRDILTWQIPTVIAAVTGFLVSKGFELIGHANPLIIQVFFILATGFAFCSTVALWQNLRIQKKHSIEIDERKYFYSEILFYEDRLISSS